MKNVHRDGGQPLNSQYLPPLKIPGIHIPHQPAGNHLSPRMSRYPILQFTTGTKMNQNRPAQKIISPRANPIFKSPRNTQVKQFAPQLAPLDENYETLDTLPKELHETIGKHHNNETDEITQFDNNNFNIFSQQPFEETKSTEQCRDRLSSRRERRERRVKRSNSIDSQNGYDDEDEV